jgi:aminopeptidase N
MIRAMMQNDSLFKAMLNDIQKDLGMKTINTKLLEDYIMAYSKLDLKSFFNQYLRTTAIPVLNYSYTKKEGLVYWAENVNEDFQMPVEIYINGESHWIKLKKAKQNIQMKAKLKSFKLSEAYYMKTMFME